MQKISEFLVSHKQNSHNYKYHPENIRELRELISDRLEKEGPECNLNDIDISRITDLSLLFWGLNSKGRVKGNSFNGDISRWNTSNVTRMRGTFADTDFNGDISGWDVSNVETMEGMFMGSKFNGNISLWDISNVRNMSCMFLSSDFKQDLSEWKVNDKAYTDNMFNNCDAPLPDWYKQQ